MRLGAAPASNPPGLQLAVRDSLDRRLRPDSPRPLSLALSGGGDSVALLLAASDWATETGRRLLVLTVDHGLRPESAAWTERCAALARRLGHNFRALNWTGEKPATGLPAAARRARHALLADAAREAGARVILLGHTADDRLEARLMRQAGSSTSEPREWGPSPAWPEGRGVFLLRPMLGLRRADIRAWLTARGETWIDDPANQDAAYARPRARQALAAGATAPCAPASPSAAGLALACRLDAAGGFEIARGVLRDAAPDSQARFVSAACLCAAGTDRPPARARVERLAARLAGAEPFVASLAGARVQADATEIRFVREAGEAARGGLAPITLRAGETGVWDGRFEITADRDIAVSPAPRSTAPDAPCARQITHDRLLAACGAVDREPA